MADFEKAIREVFKVEVEGLTQVKGESDMTFTGIYRKENPHWAGWILIDKYRKGSDLSGMPKDEYERLIRLAKEFYRTNYWNKIQGNNIKNQDVANTIMLGAVLSYPTTVTKLVQSMLKLKIDGVFGVKTLQAVNEVCRYDFGAMWFIAELKVRKLAYYTNLANKHRKYRRYIRGWNNRVLGLRG